MSGTIEHNNMAADRLEDFAQSVGGWFWETDAEHRFVYMSQSVELLTGIPPEWHYGKSRKDIGAPDSVEPEQWQAHLETLDRHRPFSNFVFLRKGPSGDQWMQTTGKPIFGGSGDFYGYRGIASDITAQIEAEHRTAALMNAVEQLSDMFVLWDSQDQLVLCNKRFREMNAAAVETTEPGTHFKTHIRAVLENGLFPEAKGREDAWLEERFARHRNPQGTFEMERQDGQWLLVNEQRLPTGGTVTIATDITAVKKSQARENEQAHIIETSLRAMPDGMLILDDDLEFVSWNDRLFEILNLDKNLIVESESPAKTYRYMRASRGEYGDGDPHTQVAEQEARLRAEAPGIWERRLASGRWAEIRNHPIPTGGYVSIVRDITEQRAAARMKDEFISTVSHELRTPLTSILGSLGLLASGAVGKVEEQAQGLLDIAHDNGQRLLDLINDLLDIERIASGKMEYRMEKIDTSAILEDALAAHQGYADQFGVTTQITALEPGAFIDADRTRILQVMANLLSNATKYSPANGVVEISTMRMGDSIRFSVTDRGEGIPEEYHSHIFEKFTQADSSDTRRVGGSGLGLSICRAIVLHHQGEISFETEAHKGTTFHVDLPLMP